MENVLETGETYLMRNCGSRLEQFFCETKDRVLFLWHRNERSSKGFTVQ